MAQKKISELPAIVSIVDNDILVGVDTSETATKKVPMNLLKTYVLGGVDLSNYYTKNENNNLLNAKENLSNKIQTISSTSTDAQYPSAKAVYDYIASLDAREVRY